MYIFFPTTTSTTNNKSNPLSSSAPLPPALLKIFTKKYHDIQIASSSMPDLIEHPVHCVNKATIVLQVLVCSGVDKTQSVFHASIPYFVWE